MATTVSETQADPSHHSRLWIPITANGASVGLISTRSTGHPNRRPRATNAAAHMLVLPQITMLWSRGSHTSSARIGHDQ